MPIATATCRGGEADPGEATAGRSGFERLYERHSDTVYRAALRVLANPAHAQDVVQDVFMRIWCQPDRFDEERGNIANYLRLMARSRALDIWREAQAAGRACERLRIIALHEAVPGAGDPALAAELRRERATVAVALSLLPEPQRRALLMAYWGGLTADEIAARTGVPVGTVKSRLRLALIKLRTRCGPQLSEHQLAA